MRLLGTNSSLYTDQKLNMEVIFAGTRLMLTREVSFALVCTGMFALQIIPFDSEILVIRLGTLNRSNVANGT